MATPQPDMPIGQLYALLRQRGWITKLDFSMSGLIVGCFLVNAWMVYTALPDHRWQVATVALLLLLVLFAIWLTILSFRIAYFAIIIQASLDEMPATSARLAVRFLRQGVPAGQAGG